MSWAALVDALVKRRLVALGVGVALVVASVVSATGIAFSSDVTEHMPEVSPSVRAWLELSRRFDAFNSLIIGLEEPAGPMSVEGLQAVKAVTDALAAKKAEGVLSVASVTNVDSIREGEDGALETALLIPEIPRDEAGLEALRARVAADAQVSGALISRDQRGYMVLVRGDPRKDPARLAALVQQTVGEHRGPLADAYFGAAFFSAVITRGVYAKLTWLVPAFVLLLVGVLALRVRRWRVIGAVLAGAVASLVLWLGLVRALGIVVSFTSLTGLLGVLAVAVAAYARALEDGSPGPFPSPVAAAVVASGLAALPLRWLPFAYVSTFGLGMTVGAAAVLLAGLLVVTPLAPPMASASPSGAQPLPLSGRVALAALALTLLFAAVSVKGTFRATPETMFSPDDDIGRSLAFFDRRFGGPDFIQVDFKGDLRDPQMAARLMRLTQLLEGSRAFPDVRSVTQVLGFLNQGFGGVYRIPSSRESLANLWFFLEGREDVRNLVLDGREEGMAVLRVPSKPSRPMAELVGVVETAIADSLKLGPEGAVARLEALAKSAGVELQPGLAAAAVGAVGAQGDGGFAQTLALERVRTWLMGPDSPWAPEGDEWERLAAALSTEPAGREAAIRAVAQGIETLEGHEDEVTASLLSRLRDETLLARAQYGVRALGDGLPETFRLQATGVLVDVLDPPAGAGDAAQVTVTGLPVERARIEADLMGGLRAALVFQLVAGFLALLVMGYRPKAAVGATLAAALAAAATLGTTGTFGFGVDSGSASLFLVPSLVALVAFGGPPSTTLRAGFLVALGAAALSLLLVGLAPLSRIALALAVGLPAAAITSQWLGPGLKRPRA